MKNIFWKHCLSGLIAILTAVVFTGCAKMEKQTMAEGISPVIDQEGADPYVMKQGEWYYYTKTAGDRVILYRSDRLTNIAAGESCVLYEPVSELESLWAPELFYLDDVWYVYFAAKVPGEPMHQMYVLSNENADPFAGSWECSPMAGMDDKFAIDGTVLELASGRYFIWSGWEGYENVRQDLYLAEMISPTEVMEEKILLSVPEYDWEKQGEPLVNEGPEIIIKEQTINLVYSASGSWTDDYCLGLLTADVQSDVKQPESWHKQETPILRSGSGVWGPGHNSFTESPDGSQTVLIYHAARWQGAGWSRSVRFGYADFDESGKLLSMEPAASDQLLPPPAGEPAREVFLSDTFEAGEGIVLQDEPGTVSAQAAVGFADTQESVSVTIPCKEQKNAVLHIYLKIMEFTGDHDQTGIQVEVNDEIFTVPVYPADCFQPVAVPAELKKGTNHVTIRSEAGGSVLAADRIEIG